MTVEWQPIPLTRAVTGRCLPLSPPLWCEKYLNVPFVADGRGFDGCDCWGGVVLVYRTERKIELDPFEAALSGELPNEMDEEALGRFLMLWEHERERTGCWRKVEVPDVFDVIELDRAGFPHCGVVVARYQFLHASQGAGRMLIEHWRRPQIRSAVRGFYQYVGSRS